MSQHDIGHGSQLQHIFGNAPPSMSASARTPSSASVADGNSRPRRKNTKSDLGYRGSTTTAGGGDDASVLYTDDGSEGRHSHYKRRTSRQPNLINTIVIWLKNTNKMRYIQITKFFYRWRYNAAFLSYQQQSANTSSTPVSLSSQSNERKLIQPATPTSNIEAVAEEGIHPLALAEGSVTSSPNSALESGRQQQQQHLEQRNSYLQLFSENEKLREQIVEMKKSMRSNERSTRQYAMKIVLPVILKKRLLNKLRYYYDIWLNNSKIMQIMSDMKQKQIELYVGLQQVESEREYVKSLEGMNSQLKMSLFLTIFFYQWKAKTSLLLLHSEREKYEKQKKIVYQELAKIRKIIEQANHLESSEMKSSLLKGSTMQLSLLSIQQKLAFITNQNQQFRQQQQQIVHQQQQQLHGHHHSSSSSHHQHNLKKTSSMSVVNSNNPSTSPGGNGYYYDDAASVVTTTTKYSASVNTVVASTYNNIPFDNNSINSSNATFSKKVSGTGSKKDKRSN